MILPAEAKERYGFRDANDREDALTLSLLNSIQAIQKSKALRIAESLMPFIVLGLCVAVGIYSYHNGLQLSMLVLPLCMLLVYIPQIKDMINQKKDGSSGIVHDTDVLGTHFLLGYGTCISKETHSHMGSAVYTLKVRLQSGEELGDVVTVREFYERTKENGKVFVAMADSPKAAQLLGVVPALYDTKVMKEKGNEQAQRPDSRKLRRISDAERSYCADYYQTAKRALLNTQLKNRSLVYLLPAAFFAAISFPLDRVIFMTLALILLASFIFTYVADEMEIRSTLKSLHGEQEVFVLDAQVTDKPILKSTQARSKGKTQAIDFRDSAGKLVLRSTRIDDWKPLEIGDRVLLVYIGKKHPLSCRKPVEELPG